MYDVDQVLSKFAQLVVLTPSLVCTWAIYNESCTAAMDLDNLKQEIDCDEEGPSTPVHVLMQNADESLEDIGDEVLDRPPTDILNTDSVDVSLTSTLNIDDQPSVSQINQMADIDPINNISAVDIVTLQPSQLQSMFQIMGATSDGGSYILSDGQLLQTTASGESQGLQSVTLPNGMATLIQADCRDTDTMGSGQAVQLEDGTTAIITNMQGLKENALASKILQNQVIQLEDGTTGFLQAGFPGSDGVQSVQLEDGSTAYISLFGEATAAGNLSIDTNSVQQPVQQAIEVAIGRNNPMTSGQTGSIATASISTDSAGTSFHKANLLTLLNQPTVNVSQKQPEKVTFTHQGMDGIESVGDKVDLTQPHVSERAIAMGDKAYKCMYGDCGRLYTTHHHLKVHERSHTGDKPFKCEFGLCGKAFPTGYGLKSHTRVHTGEKPYRCSAPECVKAFKTSGDLQKHVRTHTGERPFHCPFEGCDRSFTTSNIRKVHIRTHTGERPYVCQEDGCNKSFASATNYKNHIRIHTGEKPYVCTVEGCGKRFTEYSSLYKHHVVHTQSKPYVCNHCHKTYRQTSTLAMHKRTVHNDHEITLDPDGNLLGSVGRVQILEQCDLANISERDPDMATESDGTLVINTSDASLIGGPGCQDGARMLTTLQNVTSGSSALLQHLRPTLAVDGVPQVYLITDPTQLSQTIKSLATQSGSADKLSVVTVARTSDNSPTTEVTQSQVTQPTNKPTSSDTVQLDSTSKVITVISPIPEPPDTKDELESIGS